MYRSNQRWWHEYSTFIRSGRWQAVRREVLARDGYRCQQCGGRAAVVHHLHYAGDWADAALLVSLCAPCHNLVHGRALSPYSAGSRFSFRIFRGLSFQIGRLLIRAKSFPRRRWRR
jgi:5-methylcytosine-specific restriction endonuclease McrA